MTNSVRKATPATLFVVTVLFLAVVAGGCCPTEAKSQSAGEGKTTSEPKEEGTMKKITANLMVEDVDKTIAYYRDLLGFELAMTEPQEEPFQWAMMTNGGAELMFQSRASLAGEYEQLFGDIPLGGSFTLFIEVNDVRALFEKVKTHVEMVKELEETFYGMIEFTIRDLDGYLLTFAQPAEQQ